MSPARFRWGILFILVGVILLLNNIGELDWWVWSDILSLWPLILIAIGLEKIFSKSKAEVIAYLPILGLAAVVLWVAFDGLDDDDRYRTRSGRGYRYIVDMESDIEKVEAKFDLGDIDASLSSTGTRLFRARSSDWKWVPEVEFDRSGNVGQLEVSAERKRISNWMRIDKWGDRDDWDLYLTNRIPVSMECIGDESDMILDCRALLLEDLMVDSEQGDIRIKLGELREIVKVMLKGEEADFRISVPAGIGVRVAGAGEDLSRYFEREGLVESGGVFTTEGYDTLKTKIEFDLSGDITQFALDYY